MKKNLQEKQYTKFTPLNIAQLNEIKYLFLKKNRCFLFIF